MQESALQDMIAQFSVFRLALALFLVLLVWGFVHLLRLGTDRLAAKFSRYRLFISNSFPVLRLFIWIGSLAFIVFVVFDPPINTVITIGASLGLAVGLGAQDLIRNIIAGLLILVDRPFRVGDMIEVGSYYGEVKNIGLRSTRIQTFGDSQVTLPNSMILGQAVSNSNAGELDELVEVEFTLPGDVDVPLVKRLAWEAAACSPYAYLKKPVSVVVSDHYDRAFLTRLKVKAYVLDVRFERLFASDITERFKVVVRERGLLTPLS